VGRWILVCLLSALVPPVHAQLRVTYVANEGFLLEGGGHKVLVDALTGRGISPYPTIPPAMRPNLEDARLPFYGVDLVLATHHHPDHFDPEAVARHLRANPGARFVSTPQAVERLRKTVGPGSGLLARIEAVLPPEGQRHTIRHRGFEVVVLNLHHGRDRRPPVQNIGFLARMGGVRWLHVGDTEVDEDDIRPYGLPDERIDVAFLPTWLLHGGRGSRVVQRQIRPTRIVVMHRVEDTASADYFAPDRDAEGQRQRILEDFPSAVFLDEPGHPTTFGP
jgi:L-ascorbate metabolism protein UlaG (beta-lactamase superfamily)